jgi:hypothetical protein
LKSTLKFVGAAVSLLLASMGTAMAAEPNLLPEPGSLALVGAAIAAAVVIKLRKKK